MKISAKKPDMTGWSKERKESFDCMCSNEPETLDEVMENVIGNESMKKKLVIFIKEGIFPEHL